jgi:hypothetical protein
MNVRLSRDWRRSPTWVSRNQSTVYENVREVNRIAMEIAKQIRSQHTIAYAPSVSELDETSREIHRKVSARGEPKVRTRTGYQAVVEEREKYDTSGDSLR